MNHVGKAVKEAKPLVVLDFVCDHCGKKINAVIVATNGTQTRIAKAYHDECWTNHVLPGQKLQRVN